MKQFFSFALVVAFAMLGLTSFGQNYPIIEGIDTLFTPATVVKQDSLYKIWWNQKLKEGYFAASSRKEGNSLKVEKGALYSFSAVSGIDSTDLSQWSSKRQLNLFKTEGFTYSDLELFSRQQLIKYENNGYPFCRINYIPLNRGKELILQPEIKKGNYISLDSLVVKSATKFSSQLLAKLLQLEIGSGYNEGAIAQIQNKVDQLPFLKLTRSPEVLFGDNDAQVYLYIEKQKANKFDGIIGFQPESESGKTQVTGDVSLELLNALNQGEKIQLHWRRIQNGIQELDASFRYPYVLKTSLGLGGEIEVYRRDSTFSSARLRGELAYLFTFDQSISGFIESWTSNSLQSSFSANADVDITRYGSRLIIGKTDSRINPLKAYHLDIEGSAGFKTIPAIEENNDDITGEQYVLQFDASFRRKIIGELGFGLLAKGGKKWDNTTLLAGNELFRIGGLNSIRGFNEEQFFAESFAVGGIELVYRLDRSTSIFGFFDQSWYQQNIDGKFEDQPYGFGAGLNLGSKAGQFKLIYALGSQNGSPILFREAKLHFGFINLF